MTGGSIREHAAAVRKRYWRGSKGERTNTGSIHCTNWISSQGSGALVNTSSMCGLVGTGTPAYVGSKHGVIGLTKAQPSM